jgi:hypothetical protein
MQSKEDALLNPAQIKDLASFIREERGIEMRGIALDEEIGLLLEDLAGFETASDSTVEDYTNMIRRTYYELCNH